MSSISIGHSTSATRADLDTELALPGDSRTVTTVSDYLDNNKVANVKDFGALGDGVTDDTASIQTASDYASTQNIELVFPPGTYVAAAVLIANSITICGIGRRQATLKLKALAAGDGSPILAVSASNVTIRGITFDGNRSNQPADGFSDSWNTGAGATGRSYRAAIAVQKVGDGLSDVTVEDCHFTECYGAGAATLNVSRVKIRRCTAENNNFEAAFVYSNLLDAGHLAGHEIVRNDFRNTKSGDAVINANSIVVSSAENFIVADNLLIDQERNGIKLEYCRQGRCVGNVIVNNTIDQFGGIQLQPSGADIEVAGNVLVNCQAGITLNAAGGEAYTNVHVHHNIIDGTISPTTANGISFGGTPAITNCVVESNALRNIGRNAIDVRMGPSNGLKIQGNKHRGQGLAANGGIYIRADTGNPDSVSVVGNTLDLGGSVNSNLGMIRFDRLAAYTFSNVTIRGNEMLTGAGHTALFDGADIITSGVVSDNVTDGQNILSSTGLLVTDSHVAITGGANTAPGHFRTITASPATLRATDKRVFVKLAAPGPVALTLPATPLVGWVYTIIDSNGDSSTNPITISPSSGTINGTASLVLASNFGSVQLLYQGSGIWRAVGSGFLFAKQSVAAAATDATTTQTLANSLRAALISLGLAQ